MPKEKIIQCKRYLEDKLGEPISESALEESSGDMRVFAIKDIDVYHKVAQSLNVSQLMKKRNIHYNIYLPDKSRWSVILSNNSNWQFEQKYGDKYNIIRVKERPTDTTSKQYKM